MKDEWKQSWEKAKYSRELFKLGIRPEKAILNIYMSNTQSNRFRHYIDMYWQDQSTRISINKADTTNTNIDSGARRYAISVLNTGTG